MDSQQLLSIIIVNYNTRDLLENCIRSIDETLENLEAEVLVVDNDSSDNSVEMVEQRFPDIKLISNPINVGYAKAVNQALKSTTGQFILILNADTKIKPHAIQSLISFMKKKPDAGIAGPKLFYPDGRLQYSCRTFYSLKTILLRRTILGRIFNKNKNLKEHLMLEWDHNDPREVDWMLGAALMVRREAINQIGLMDERYFLYLEDVDWCYRMKNAGWKVYYESAAVILHHYRQGSRSETMFNRDVLIHFTSMLRYYDKWNKVHYALKKLLNILKRPAFIAIDIISILISFLLAFQIRIVLDPIGSKPLYPMSVYIWPLVAFTIITVSTNYLMGLYENRGKQVWVDLFFSIGKSTLIASLFTILLFIFSKGYNIGFLYSRLVLLVFIVFAVLMVTFVHQMKNLISRWIWRQRFNLKRLLIVGLCQTAMKLKDTLSNSPDLGYDLVGLISLEKNSNNSLVDQTTGNVDELIEICHRERVQEVIFVNVENHYEKIIRSLIKCRKMLIDIRIISDDFELQAVNPRTKDFAGFSSIDHECKPLYYIGLGIKRLADIIIASIGLIILSPFILIIALLLKFDGNSTCYNQIRIGKNGKKFLMYKFRTMVPGAESQKADLENIAANGPFFKVRDDPRVTRFGKFLRKYNLDEIPQLLNVLRGELSFIGPRPPLPEEVTEYEDWHLSRLEVKPGITGLWQVDKKRKWKFDEMVKLDIYYILNWSILLDFKILLRTPGAILRGSGF